MTQPKLCLVLFLGLFALFFTLASADKVHAYLVPHSHDDVGWLETIDGYYNDYVHAIYNTTIAELKKNASRKFIYVEQAYFTKWWNDPSTTDSQRNDVRFLIKNGQIEFVIGGWVMHDEACVTFSAAIDQLTEGHQFLLRTFGIKPTKGWQIDPFGAGSTTPILNKLAGFDGHIIQRITYSVHDALVNLKSLEFFWTPSNNLGKESTIFTQCLPNNYCNPMNEGYDFESKPLGDVATTSKLFVQTLLERHAPFRTPYVLVPYGCDFHWVNAAQDFSAMDQIINYINANSDAFGLDIRYSTLSEYFEVVRNYTPDPNFPSRGTDDFLPYADGTDSFWSGYFTSKSQVKGVIRKGEGFLHAVDSIFSIARARQLVTNDAFSNYIWPLRQANAEAQHHDAVTGTSKALVSNMYIDHINQGTQQGQNFTSSALAQLIAQTIKPSLTSNNLLQNAQTNTIYAIVLFNSLGWERNEIIKIPSSVGRGISVYDSSQNSVSSQVDPAFFPGGSPYNIFFKARIPALGFSTYFISVSATASKHDAVYVPLTVLAANQTIENDYLRLTFSSAGRLNNIENLKKSISVPVDQNILAYSSYVGGGQQSGAYIFRPNAANANPIVSSTPKILSSIGPLVQEIYQEFNEYASQSFRLYRGDGDPLIGDWIDINHRIGPLPEATELITKFSTGINTGNPSTFFTDDQGYEIKQRVYTSAFPSEIVASNYYPSTNEAFIKDDKSQLSLLFDRTHGVSSQATGALEVMLHRRTPEDDSRGVGEALNDQTVVDPNIRLIFETPDVSAQLRHRLSVQQNFPIVPFFSTTSTISYWLNNFNTFFTSAKAALPDNVHILSFKATDGVSNGVIIRLIHLFENGEDSVLSQPISVDLNVLFKGLTISSCKETTLTANQDLVPNSNCKANLTPKTIKTFVVEFSL